MIHGGRLSLSAVLVRAGLLFGVLLIAGVVARAAAAESIAVPAYFYPGGTPTYWTQLDQAAPGALAVVNPDSGPGSAPDLNYVGAVKSAEAAGITVVGYVYTNYGSRSSQAVESDVNKYYNWYSADGIFFDQASTSCANESYYAQLNNYVKAKGGLARTVLNPGTQTNQCYASAADTLLTFEGSDSDYVNCYSAPSWVSSYPAFRFGRDLWNLDDVGDGYRSSAQQNAQCRIRLCDAGDAAKSLRRAPDLLVERTFRHRRDPGAVGRPIPRRRCSAAPPARATGSAPAAAPGTQPDPDLHLSMAGLQQRRRRVHQYPAATASSYTLAASDSGTRSSLS